MSSGAHTTPVTAALIRGAIELESTSRGLLPHRLPGWARAQATDGQLLMAESQPAGILIAVRTAATTVELETVPTKRVYTGLPPRPDGVYDLLLDGRLVRQGTVPTGDTVHLDLSTGASRVETGHSGRVRFDGLPPHEKDLEIWLPHDETTVLVALHTDAPVTASARSGRRVWLHHGSSISQGSHAASPSHTWPALASRRAGVELVNVGLGGGALLDPFTARTLRDTPADVVTLKLGINVVNTDLMRLRAFGPAVHGFLDTVREGHPDTPLLVITPLHCPIHEDTPGPSAPDPSSFASGQVRFLATGATADVAAGRLTLRVVRTELARIVGERSADDPRLHLLDGETLYGPDDHTELPLPDSLHPDAATHLRIGERFATAVFGPGGPFGKPPQAQPTG